MASNTNLQKKYGVVDCETIASDFATSKTLSGGGATIPANAGEVLCTPSAACHYNPNGTATSTFMHEAAANEMFVVKVNHVGTVQIIGDGGAIALKIIYLRGAARQDLAYTAQALPN